MLLAAVISGEPTPTDPSLQTNSANAVSGRQFGRRISYYL